MFEVRFSEEAKKGIAKFKKSNPIAYNKVVELVKSISVTPRDGIGHPEPLKRGNNNLYSRKIDKKNRLVYEIHDDFLVVLVLSAEGHYSDK